MRALSILAMKEKRKTESRGSRLPVKLWRRLARVARKEKISLNALIREILEDYVERGGRAKP